MRGEAVDPAASEAESVRRARTQLRRYCVGNGLRYLWTLTYAPEHLPEDEDGVWSTVEGFRRKLYAELGRKVPLAMVIEHGSVSGRLHVHFLSAERLPHAVVERAWGLGWVWVEPPPKVRGLGRRARLRLAAAYLTKYVGKDWDQVPGGAGAGAAGERPARRLNRKRYSVTKGYRPVRTEALASTLLAAMRKARESCGGELESWWSSEDQGDQWRGPPTWLLRFD